MVRLLLTDQLCFDSVKLIAFTGSWGVSPDSRNLIYLEFLQLRENEKKKNGGPNSWCVRLLLILQTVLIYIWAAVKLFISDDFCEWLESRAYGKTALMCAMKLDTDLSVFVCIKVLSGCGRVSGRESASLYLGLVTLRWIWVTRTWHDVYICVLYALSRASHTHMHAHAGRPSASGSHWRRRAEQQMS